ncbi:MAG: hypothetical protein GXO80_12445 [Chlorobi bacterium]|nr:hypothetical protein [Chlorobiota bacterium]
MKTQFLDTMHSLWPLILILTIFELVMKLIALWRAGRNNHLAWFIVIGIINSAGILPVIYLLINRKNKVKED